MICEEGLSLRIPPRRDGAEGRWSGFARRARGNCSSQMSNAYKTLIPLRKLRQLRLDKFCSWPYREYVFLIAISKNSSFKVVSQTLKSTYFDSLYSNKALFIHDAALFLLLDMVTISALMNPTLFEYWERLRLWPFGLIKLRQNIVKCVYLSCTF